MIGVDKIDETTLDCLTRSREFNGIPKRDGKELLGLMPLEFLYISDRIIRIS